MKSGYVIDDEPRPGALSHMTVRPLWPFLATMLAGAWFALPWFILNGFAIGSATRLRELATGVAGVLSAAGVWFLAERLVGANVITEAQELYVVLLVPGCKLLAAYSLHDMQTKSFELYDLFGGRHRNGALGLVLGIVLRGYVLGALPSAAWRILAA